MESDREMANLGPEPAPVSASEAEHAEQNEQPRRRFVGKNSQSRKPQANSTEGSQVGNSSVVQGISRLII